LGVWDWERKISDPHKIIDLLITPSGFKYCSEYCFIDISQLALNYSKNTLLRLILWSIVVFHVFVVVVLDGDVVVHLFGNGKASEVGVLDELRPEVCHETLWLVLVVEVDVRRCDVFHG
jgi:hypothetical protein